MKISEWFKPKPKPPPCPHTRLYTLGSNTIGCATCLQCNEEVVIGDQIQNFVLKQMGRGGELGEEEDK